MSMPNRFKVIEDRLDNLVDALGKLYNRVEDIERVVFAKKDIQELRHSSGTVIGTDKGKSEPENKVNSEPEGSEDE